MRTNTIGGGRFAERAALHLILIGVLVLLLFPIYWILVTSLKTPAEAYRLPPTFWPQTVSFESYPFMVQAWQYWRTLANTLLVAGAAALIATILGGSAAYAFHRARFPGRAAVITLVELPLVMPPAVAGIALLVAFGRLGLLGHTLSTLGISLGFTQAAVIIAITFVSSPFYLRGAIAAFAAVDETLIDVGATLGAGPVRRATVWNGN